MNLYHLVAADLASYPPMVKDHINPPAHTLDDVPEADKGKFLRYIHTASLLRETRDGKRKLVQMQFADGPADQVWMSAKQFGCLEGQFYKTPKFYSAKGAEVYGAFELQDDGSARFIWAAFGVQDALKMAIRFRCAVPELLLDSGWIRKPYELVAPEFVEILPELIDD